MRTDENFDMIIPFSVLFTVVFAFCLILYLLSRVTSVGIDGVSYFNAGRKAPWGITAYGMVGASISGVTFISVPGNVLAENFYYLPMVVGFVLGYFFVAGVLLPLFYTRGDLSIYSYLSDRFGIRSRRIAAFFFFLSRLCNCAVRIFVVAVVLLSFYTGDNTNLVFVTIVLLYLLMLFVYTYRGGVKTLVWTDVFHTTVMLLAVGAAISFLLRTLSSGEQNLVETLHYSKYLSVFDFDPESPTNLFKQVAAGFCMTVAMTGLDQGMMQKSLGCKNLKSARKNIYATAGIILLVNLTFLFLGALFAIYIEHSGGMDVLGISSSDAIFPWVAMNLMGPFGLVLFVLGLISSSYPSSAAAVTSLTSSVYHDFLGFDKSGELSQRQLRRNRVIIESVLVLVIAILVLCFHFFNNTSVLNLIYTLASYTYGPLLGLYGFAIWGKSHVSDRVVPWICTLSPLLSFAIKTILEHYVGFDLGFSLLILNGVITFVGLMVFKKR